MTQYLSPLKVAKLWDVDQRTVTRWCREGRIPGVIRTPGGRWRIPEEALKGMAGPRGETKPDGNNIGPTEDTELT